MSKKSTKTIQQLEREVARAKHPRATVSALHSLALAVLSADVNRAVALVKEALSLSEQIQYLQGIADSCYHLADMYSVMVGDNNLALEYGSRALTLFRQLDDPRNEAWTLKVLGGIHVDMGTISEAEDCLRQAREIAAAIGLRHIEGSIHGKLGILYKNTGRYEEAIACFQIALEFRRKKRDTYGESSIVNNIGTVYTLLGDYAQAIRYYTQSLHLKRENNDQYGISSTLNNIANVFLKFSDFENALLYFRESLAIKESTGNLRGAAATLNNIGSILTEFHKYDEAHALHRKALELYRQLLQPQKVSLTLNLLGVNHIHAGRLTEGLEALMESYHLRREQNDTHGLASSCLSIAHALQVSGDIPHAIDYAKRGCDYCISIAHKHRLPEHYLGLAKIYLQAGSHADALTYAQKAIDLAGEQGDKRNLYLALECAAQAQEKSGNLAEALRKYKQFIEIKQQMLNEATAHKTNTLLVQFDTERMQHDNEILRLKAEEAEKQAEFYNRELQLIALHLVEKNEFLKQIKTLIQQNVTGTESELKKLVTSIESNVAAKEEWQTFKQKFDRAHDEFIQRLSKEFPQLTPMELKVAALLRIHMENKDIANLLYASVRTIEGHRLNLRKKLGLGLKDNLSVFLAGW
ncbi:MAG: tetratricopeptide repeat protein [Candidatus Kapaibacterium sp.]